ncbi:hypothetical protein M8523_09195 [Hyphomicrobiales bacterium BP6-180914]|uniref:TtsA-like Glycoside hydrolase family 108 domain-containing protein n=1 Tax=Lichenifustis flavocetrariae TaxID=2949735 RepID=A0AA41YTB2_9HYPH|nr:hypothetical protein [Lichenifustis flavocetrariae]
MKADPGNWSGGAVGKGELRGTKYGIAAASHPYLDIRNLTLAQASDIYWAEYCRAPGFDRLPLPLCQEVFDAGVMSGPARAAAWLVDARREATLTAQIAAISAERLAFCRSRKTWRSFGAGWGAWIAACEKRGLLLAAAAPVALPDHTPGREPLASPSRAQAPLAAASRPARPVPPRPHRRAVFTPSQRSTRMTVDLTAFALAAINQLGPIVLTGVASLLFKAVWPEIVKFLGEKNAATFQARVNEVLNAAIGFAVQKGGALVTSHGALTIDVKNVLVGMAVDYASKHAPDLMTQAGDIVEKVLARFDTHPSVQGLIYATQPLAQPAA